MTELSETLNASTEFAGNFKLVNFTATIGSATDTVILTEAQAGIKSIVSVIGAVITGGFDANFALLQVSVSALTVSIASFEADGTVSTEWTGTTVEITVLGKTDT